MLPIPNVQGHPTDSVAGFRALLVMSPTTDTNQPLLAVTKDRNQKVVTTFMLSRAMKVQLEALQLDSAT